MYSGDPLPRNPCANRSVPGSRRKPVPIIRLYGVTQAGNSVLANIHGFTPYFYCNTPPGMTPADLGKFRAALEHRLQSEKRNSREHVAEIVLAIDVVPKMQSLLGYHFEKTTNFLKVYMAMPNYVSQARGILERGLAVPGFGTRGYQCYEANVPFVLRFMIDCDVVGCNWIECPPATYSLRPRSRHSSSAQIEVDIVYDSLVSHAPDGEWQRLAPVRVLSFDIECAGRKVSGLGLGSLRGTVQAVAMCETLRLTRSPRPPYCSVRVSRVTSPTPRSTLSSRSPTWSRRTAMPSRSCATCSSPSRAAPSPALRCCPSSVRAT